MKVLPNGSVKTECFEMDIHSVPGAEYVKSKNTGEIYKDTFQLFYSAYNENRLPYDKPIVDNPSDYIIRINGEDIDFKEFLQNNNGLNKHYAVISNKTKITSVEHFVIFPHNRFYSVQISEEIADFLIASGLDNFTVQEDLLGLNLSNIDDRSDEALLFFIESNNYFIQDKLNSLRRRVLALNCSKQTDRRICEGGLFPTPSGGLFKLNFSFEDRLSLFKAAKENRGSFVNTEHEVRLAPEEVKFIYSCLSKNYTIYSDYAQRYAEYINKTVRGSFRFNNNKEGWTSVNNPLFYGYSKESKGEFDGRSAHILTMPFSPIDCNFLMREEAKKRFELSDDITVLICGGEESLAARQFTHNGHAFYAVDIEQVSVLLGANGLINTKYTLVINGDALVIKDLSEEFVNKFLSVKTGYVLSASVHRRVNHNFLGGQEISLISKGPATQIDGCVCFGYTNEVRGLLQNYQNKEGIQDAVDNVMRMEAAILSNDYHGAYTHVDANCTLFHSVDLMQSQIREDDRGRYVFDVSGVDNGRRLF